MASVPGTITPEFPPELRGRRTTASLLAEFVVDTLGHFDASTLQIVRSPATDAEFVAPVARAISHARFTAARVDGRHVPQRVYLPVIFRFGNASLPPIVQGSPCGPMTAHEAVVVTAVTGTAYIR
ncbi:MAG: energy transducer TonB [Candidatus Eremiobacteraeota bacterium]|nr:energy transducer TonB [Candidatus Eremiobacteraeota bacterium]